MAAQQNVVYVTNSPPPYEAPYSGVAVTNVSTTLVVNTPVGPDPITTTCPSCLHQIVTRTERTPTSTTHLCACILFCFICWPCVCLPYCMNSCNNVDHYCPNCNAYIGGYKH